MVHSVLGSQQQIPSEPQLNKKSLREKVKVELVVLVFVGDVKTSILVVMSDFGLKTDFHMNSTSQMGVQQRSEVLNMFL